MLAVQKDKARKLFAALGYATVKKWDDDRLGKKLVRLSKDGVDEGVTTDDIEMNQLLEEVVFADGDVCLIDNSAKKSKKKAKAEVTEEEVADAAEAVLANDPPVTKGKKKKVKAEVTEEEIDELDSSEEDEVVDEPTPKAKKKKKVKAVEPDTSPVEEIAKKKKKKVKVQDSGTEPAPKKTKAVKTAPSKTRGAGVVATIIECLKKKPCTKEQILNHLIKKFPDRGEKMRSTVNTYVPFRLNFDKKLNVQTDKDGKFFISE
jgi:hypothetical protein